MKPVVFLILLLAVAAVAHAEVTVVSADEAAEIGTAPDREFPCATLPWTDPDAPLPALVFYNVIGATGPIYLNRSGTSAEVWSESAAATPPDSGGTLEQEASWGGVRIQSGTAIGRALTPEPSGEVVLRDVDGSAGQYFEYDPVTLGFQVEGGGCLEADETGVSAVPCTGAPRQQWIVDREGRLRANTCEGDWACLVTPGFTDGVAAQLQACGDTAQPEQTWAVEHWNDPVDTESLLAGLSAVKLPFTYWPVVAVEGAATPILLAEDGRPIVAAGSAGPGRVAAFGTWQSVCGTTSDQTFEVLLTRLIQWAGQTSGPVIGLAPEAGSQQACFSQLGFTTVPATPNDLDGVDVYVMRGGDDGAPATDVAHLEDFLRAGGGILASHHVFFYWDVQQYPPTDNLIAAVFSRAGVAWSEDLDEAAYAGSTLDLSGDVPSRDTYQIAAAFEAFIRHSLGIESSTSEVLSAIEANMPVAVTARVLMSDVSPFTVAQRAFKRVRGPLVIGPEQPYTWDQSAIADMALRGDYVLAEALPADRTRAHESAELFPGPVAPEVPRVTRSVTIDGDVPDESHEMWRSTGLYAPPGEVVTFRFPVSVAAAGVFVQIGASFDHVMPHVGFLEPNTIGRFPWVTAGRLVQTEEIELAGAFGGPVLVSVPSGSNLGAFQVEIEGALEAPAVSLGPGGEAEWTADLADAPLVELQADHLIITMRSSVVDSAGDPVAALQQLDAMIVAEADLVGVDDDQTAAESIPQRLVFDPFEEWGAHSGYPVHMTQSWDASLIDTTVWPDGSGLWGFIHEYGHNHQQGMWTLNHQGEVTCNILAVYAFETVLGLPMSEAWGGNLEPATMHQRTQDWLDTGQPYSTQGYDVGLYFFLYVKEAFGWEPFQTMYAEYRALPPGERPNTEQEKIDQLAVRLSHATGRNLVPWFLTFRFPVSLWVLGEVNQLPPWDTAPF